MRKIIGLVLLVCLLSGTRIDPVRAQSTPVYSVAYFYRDGIRVATLNSDNTWKLHDLPNIDFYRWTRGNWQRLWSPDGRLLYVTRLLRENNPKQIRSVYAYNVVSETLDKVIDLAPIKGHNEEDTSEYCIGNEGGGGLAWISPDGRYGLLVRGCGVDTEKLTKIVDLQQKRIVVDSIDCDAEVADYLPEIKRITLWGSCGDMTIRRSFTVIDMDTWKPVVHVYDGTYGSPPGGGEIPPGVTYVRAFGESTLIKGRYPYYLMFLWPKLTRLHLDTGQLDVIAQLDASYDSLPQPTPARVSQSQTFAVLAFKNRLLRLDFGTLKLQDIGPVDKSIVQDILTASVYFDSNPQRVGDMFYFIQTIKDHNHLELSQVAVSATTRTDTVLYSGPDESDNMSLTWAEIPVKGPADSTHYFLLITDGQLKVDIRLLTATGTTVSEKRLFSGDAEKLFYNVGTDPADQSRSIFKGYMVERDGNIDVYSLDGPIWSSKAALSDKIVSLNESYTLSDPWYSMTVKDKPGDEGQEALFNPYTGEVVNAPLPALRYVGASPDGAWWIYADNDEDAPVTNYRIVAYQRTTGTKVTLAEGPIGPTKERSFSWSPSLK